MKAKRVLKVTGKIILVILILIIVVLIITSVLFRLRVNKAKDYLKSNGYYNLVSAGDYNVNVYSCGNENGRHTIVALAGYLDGEMYIGWRKMTTTLEEDNRLVFLDRAGYGVSDDYRGEMTAEHVVEHYRTALQNAGIQAPYVLMPHSMGGVYTTYWASQYPDEIEAVMIIDGSEAQHFDLEKDALDLDIVKWMRRAGNLGLLPPVINSDYERDLKMLSDEEKPVSSALLEKTMSSHASTDEMLRWQENCNYVWDT
ncbi:MAG: alpha/beta hydrolase, partial [Ruminococcus sp.]|nr:alpha/beta hydrolase [Ruminococcus sp.]